MGEELKNNATAENKVRTADVTLIGEHVVMDKGDKHYDFIAFRVRFNDGTEVPVSVDRSASGLLYKQLN